MNACRLFPIATVGCGERSEPHGSRLLSLVLLQGVRFRRRFLRAWQPVRPDYPAGGEILSRDPGLRAGVRGAIEWTTTRNLASKSRLQCTEKNFGKPARADFRILHESDRSRDEFAKVGRDRSIRPSVWDHRRPTIGMAEKMVTTFNSNDLEASLAQNRYQFRACKAR